MRELETRAAGEDVGPGSNRKKAGGHHGRTWQTRPRPEVDRVGSAWLIRKFIDSEAKFMFSSAAPPGGEVIAFDMVDVEFSHHGDRCTFETLIQRFAIDDKAARIIADLLSEPLKMFVLRRLIGQQIGRSLDLDGADLLEFSPDGDPRRVLASRQAVQQQKPRD